MSNLLRASTLFLLLCLFLPGRGATMPVEPLATPPSAEFAVLVFSKTAAFRHASIPAGIAAIQTLGQTHNFHVEASEDATLFTDDTLANFKVVVFLNTSGDILDSQQQAALARFVRRGGGFVGIHAASDTEYEWAWYGRLVGTYFHSHPAIQTATIHVVDAQHPSTSHLPAAWVRNDEWYNFGTDPSAAVNVLATLDESTYDGGTMGQHHPIAWYHEFEGGRSWYTAMGHTSESYDEPLFQDHILGGILWAAATPPKDKQLYLPLLITQQN